MVLTGPPSSSPGAHASAPPGWPPGGVGNGGPGTDDDAGGTVDAGIPEKYRYAVAFSREKLGLSPEDAESVGRTGRTLAGEVVIACHHCGQRGTFFKSDRGKGHFCVMCRCVKCGRSAVAGQPFIPTRWFTPAQLATMETVQAHCYGVCTVCGKDGYIEIHHLAPREYFDYPESEMWPQVAVCKECHDRWHRKVRDGRREAT